MSIDVSTHRIRIVDTIDQWSVYAMLRCRLVHCLQCSDARRHQVVPLVRR